MNKDLQYMFRKIALFSLVTALPVSAAVWLIFNNHVYPLFFLSGLSVALLIFFITGIMSEFIVLKSKLNPIHATRVSSFARIFFVCYLALKVYRISEVYIVPFMLGYCFHFISILLYGINIAKKGSD